LRIPCRSTIPAPAQVGERAFAVRGTPTDCVLMAVRHVMPQPPDLILSGFNKGQNLAEDITYSGTVAAAIEGHDPWRAQHCAFPGLLLRAGYRPAL
jgi:5'/3'-nucleotidase SurE